VKLPEYEGNLPLLPLSSGVVLPGMVVSMALESEEARAAIDAAGSVDGRLVVVPRIEGRFASVGVIASIIERGQLPGGTPVVVLRGDERVTVGAAVPSTGEALWVSVQPVDEEPASAKARELAREYRAVLVNILLSRGERVLAERIGELNEPGDLADVAGYSPDLSLGQKVQVLETIDLEKRLGLVLGWARETLADLTLRERIKGSVEDSLEKTQREFLLRRQLEAIRKELNELNDSTSEEPEDYRAKLEQRELPENVRAAVVRELDKLERTSEQSPEQGWIRTWLDTIFEMPWETESEDRLDIEEAGKILAADHDGLRDVKERILEHLAVKKLQNERSITPAGRGSGAILALVGPPGVGKTSLGESVARALGRRFARVALGGVHDEAEIRGHRRTYVGAQPGRLVRAIREAGTMNPVILLDEVDKIGSDWRGDPSSALLEVLDPAQNHTFRDHYLEVDLDLSKVLFIATANVAETIPGPLYDRLEVIRIDGYTEDEKLSIARHHLLPRQLERAGLRDEEVDLSDDAIRKVVAEYTREAGVRSLERELGRLLRKVATKIASGTGAVPITVSTDSVESWLGRPRFYFDAAERTAVPGVATGLAVTGVGGDVLFIEATSTEGAPGLTLTGQLGDVMKESAEIALTYVHSHAAELGIDESAFSGKRFHLHVPAGAVPKDGPSAGVTMASALTSLLTGRSVRPVVGMTGEITLQGRVLPIGGVVQKVLAAHRAGLTDVILPRRNGPDLDDLPEAVRQSMHFHLADTLSDVFSEALEGELETPEVLLERAVA
jgi:ATP-dependent Lon protease